MISTALDARLLTRWAVPAGDGVAPLGVPPPPHQSKGQAAPHRGEGRMRRRRRRPPPPRLGRRASPRRHRRPRLAAAQQRVELRRPSGGHGGELPGCGGARSDALPRTQPATRERAPAVRVLRDACGATRHGDAPSADHVLRARVRLARVGKVGQG